jgi:hypothetical protein
MAIDVTCASCKTRFQVSDKFAGKQGPCPKCKAVIKVPDKSQQVVIHEPEAAAGTKTSTGQPIFKPIAWKETRLTTLQIVIAGASGRTLARYFRRFRSGQYAASRWVGCPARASGLAVTPSATRAAPHRLDCLCG